MTLNIYLLFRFITGSYDRTCKVWNTLTGDELLSLEGHKNVVYCMAFNNPFGYRELLSNVLILAIE
jgi:WD40 repeat protein